MPARSPEEIRQSIEETRRELTYSLTDLQGKVDEITDWRSQLADNLTVALVGAALIGFVAGGGIAATVGLFKND